MLLKTTAGGLEKCADSPKLMRHCNCEPPRTAVEQRRECEEHAWLQRARLGRLPGIRSQSGSTPTMRHERFSERGAQRV
jgi:hypothetical protein